MMTSPSGQKRIMLWAVQRSLSTAMCRVMMNSGCKTEVLFEPYGLSYYKGPERLNTEELEINPLLTYSNTKKKQELPYDDKELVFAKNLAFHLGPERLTADWIPDGYVHSFIIRQPRSTIFSKLDVLKRMENAGKGRKLFDASETGYKEQVEISRVLSQLGHSIVVLDADDLLNNPEAALRGYCRAVGLDFHQSMLNWEPLSEIEYQRVFNGMCHHNVEWFNVMKSSSGILRKPRRPPTSYDDVIFDQETRDLLKKTEEENKNYYEKLYTLRLRV